MKHRVLKKKLKNKNLLILLFYSLLQICSCTWPSLRKHDSSSMHRRVQGYHHYNSNHDLASASNLQMMNAANNFLTGCNCIKLKFCNPIIEMVRGDHNGFFSDFINSQLQVSQCKYQKDEMYICCPNMHGNQNLYTANQQQNYWQKHLAKSWNWNMYGINHDSAEERGDDNEENFETSKLFTTHIQPFGMPNYISYPIQVFHPFSFPFTSNANNMHSFIANHEDVQTHKNCPPQISKEFTLKHDHTFFDEEKHKMEFISSTSAPVATTTPLPLLVPWLPERLQNKLKLVNHEECGKSSNMRIIGGEDVGEGRFPWVARLSYRNKTSDKISHRCAGSLISHKYVLTAGHCISNLIDSLEIKLVRFGDDRSQTEEDDRECRQDDSCLEEEDFEIENVIVHPSYNRPRYQNDIALIRLRQSTEFSKNSLIPICLPMLKYERFSENVQSPNGIVAGYGATSRTSTAQSSAMKWIRLPFVDAKTCASFYANYSQALGTRILISNFQLCLQGSENGDACQGDSGGPVLSDVESERYVLLGIVSFGPRSCGLSNFPGVYTRVSSYLSWILENIQE